MKLILSDLFFRNKHVKDMQYLSVISIATAAGLIGLAANFSQFNNDAANEAGKEKWYTWEEAVELNKTHPKKIMVDVYTDWCGWCKRMDQGAFQNPEVQKYIRENFYPVKLNAEQREQILFGKDTFNFVETGKGRGVNSLAFALLDGKMSYPTIVYLDPNFRRIMVSPGYKESTDLLNELKFTQEEGWKKNKK